MKDKKGKSRVAVMSYSSGRSFRVRGSTSTPAAAIPSVVSGVHQQVIPMAPPTHNPLGRYNSSSVNHC